MINDYEKFKSDVYNLTKLDLNSYKERQMKRRIDTLISKNNFVSYDEYINAIKSNTKLFNEFLNYLTINVSEFFRNPEQWKLLEKEVLPYLIDKFGKNLKIWSTACSSGDEPYSLAMVISKFMPLSQIKIYATDLDKQILEKAKVGLYNEKSVAAVPEEFKSKYLRKIGNTYQVSDDIKKCVEFRQHNLLKDNYLDNCDLIVCRNVLIYFTEEAKVEIYKKFNKALNKGGILFIGSTEQIMQHKELNYRREKSFFYEKL